MYIECRRSFEVGDTLDPTGAERTTTRGNDGSRLDLWHLGEA